MPLHHLGAVVLLGGVGMSPDAMRRCASEGREVTLLETSGRFGARVVGPTSGNVLLRKAQYDAHADPAVTARIARTVVAGKIRNSRSTVLRVARESRRPEDAAALRGFAEQMAGLLATLETTTAINVVRGLEGQAAALYFEAFPLMISAPAEEFSFRTRSRRPPRDRMNALLSFLYSLLTTDCTAAVEGVGLDPQFGYLHVLRPGRPALALDLVEEFRSCVADRLALTLVNRRQLRPDSFEEREGGSALLNADGRRAVLAAYERRKQEEVGHPLLKEPVPMGLEPHLQARLLARHLRGELEEYPPFVSR